MKKRDTARAVIGGALVFLVLLSAFMAGRDLWNRKQEADTFQELAELIEPSETEQPQEPSDNLEEPENEMTESEENNGEAERNLSALFELNADCIGWLSIPGTVVDYPVMHTPEDAERYLRKNFYGEYSTSGVPFLDARCSMDSIHLIIYGHNMRNETMFGSLKYYTDSAYFSEHPTIELETAAGKAVYEIFSVMTVEKDDAWYAFLTVADEADYRHQIRWARTNSLYDTGVTPSYGQQLLTLSTCYGSGSDGRLLIVAAKQ